MTASDPDKTAPPPILHSRIVFWRELLIAGRFALVGITATGVHLLALWFLLDTQGMAPVTANTLAFLTAFGVSFAGNYWWTFRAPGQARRAMLRFFLIALGALIANTLILSFLVRAAWFSPMQSAALSTSIVPIISFIGSRFWGFKTNS